MDGPIMRKSPFLGGIIDIDIGHQAGAIGYGTRL